VRTVSVAAARVQISWRKTTHRTWRRVRSVARFARRDHPAIHRCGTRGPANFDGTRRVESWGISGDERNRLRLNIATVKGAIATLEQERAKRM